MNALKPFIVLFALIALIIVVIVAVVKYFQGIKRTFLADDALWDNIHNN